MYNLPKNINKLPQIEATFLLCGQNDCLEKITQMLQINPTKIKRKNDFKIPEFSCFLWELSTGTHHSKALEYQCEELIQQLTGKELLINDLMEKYNLKSDFVIILHAEIGDGPEINLTKEFIKLAAHINAEIGFDVYFY